MPVIPTNKPLQERHTKDNYRTPELVALAHINSVFNRRRNWANSIIDPACGTGIYGYILRQKFPDAKIIGFDVRSREDIQFENDPDFSRNEACYNKIYYDTDILNVNIDIQADLIITNPPFKIAEQMVYKCYPILNTQPGDRGYLSFLLRQAFLESKRRFDHLWKDFPLIDYGAFVERIPWQNHVKGKQGKSDYETYAVFTWEGYSVYELERFRKFNLETGNLQNFDGYLISWKK